MMRSEPISNFEIAKENVTIKLTERSRNRLKVQIKFSAQEAEALKNFFTAIHGINEEKFNEAKFSDFLRECMFLGISTLQDNIEAKMRKELENNPEAKAKFEKLLEEANKEAETQSEVINPS